MKERDEFRLGIIGLGSIAHNAHGPAITGNCAGVKMVACADVREEAVKQWTDRYGGVGYTDYVEMVTKEELDGVLLATWPNLHFQQIERLLAAGVKKVLCEKALALTGAEAIAIYDMAAATEAFIMEGFMYRHNPVTHKLEELLACGTLGAIDNVRACFSAFDPELEDRGNPNRDWRQDTARGGGIPYDYACYCVNCCGHFAGSLPVRAYCLGGTGRYGTINRMHGTIEYGNGVVGIIESSKKSSFTQEVQISCEHGILNLPIAWTIDRDMAITQRHTAWNNCSYDTHMSEGVDSVTLSYRLQVENFASVARGTASPVIPLVQSVVNTLALEALVTSLTEKRPVDIAIPDRVAEDFLFEKARRR